MKAKIVIQNLQEENTRLRKVMRTIADHIVVFSRACRKEDYTDTGDAWNLLNSIRVTARRNARRTS